MEDGRDKLVVIVAGYTHPMVVFMAQNPGLSSRFKTVIEFDDYTDDELVKILRKLASAADYDISREAEMTFRGILAGTARTQAFGNGRFARNLLEEAIGRHAWRLQDVDDPSHEQLRELKAEDFRQLADDPEPVGDTPDPETDREPEGTAQTSEGNPAATPGRVDEHDERDHTAGETVMSRATAAPSATATAPVVARAGGTAAAAPAPAIPRSRSAISGALEGTPGRMRILAFVAAVVAAAFGLVGAMSLWSSAGALERADHNTAQVLRVQNIYADLVRADAAATSSFLVGGIEDPDQRADYDASMDRVAKGIADAADAQPADSDALGTLNAAVQDYAATIEEARVYNRQGKPVGAQYLSNASDTLRAQILPIVDTLITANKARANAEFDASSRLPVILLVGLGALAVLVLVMVWLARRTHRYLNPSMFVGTLVVLLALVIGAVTLGWVGSQVQDVRNTDFAYTVALAIRSHPRRSTRSRTRA